MITRSLTISKKKSFFLFGARSTGKSTLLQQIFTEDEALHLSLLEPKIFSELQAYPDRLSHYIDPALKQGKVIIIDEVQRIPALLDLVHFYKKKVLKVRFDRIKCA